MESFNLKRQRRQIHDKQELKRQCEICGDKFESPAQLQSYFIIQTHEYSIVKIEGEILIERERKLDEASRIDAILSEEEDKPHVRDHVQQYFRDER